MATGEFLSTKALAEKKGFSESYIKKAAKDFGLKHYQFGRRLKFKESDFDEWAEQRTRRVS